MAEIKDILKSHLETIKAKVVERMVQQKRNASGKSVASLAVTVDDTSAALWGAKSFLVMENGRGPGPVPMGFFEIIYNWAKAKGISAKAKAGQQQLTVEGALRSFSGAVAYNIMKKGTKLYRSKEHDDIYSAVIKAELEKMHGEMCISLLDQISIINQKA